MSNMPGTDHQKFITISPYYNLVMDLSILVLQILSVIGNGNKKLRKNDGLSLIFLLSLTDWIFAISAFPYIINYIAGWNPIQFDYNPHFLVISSLPLTIQFKINLVISLGIAVDRLQAIRFPLTYMSKKHRQQSRLILAGGILFAMVDVTLEFTFTNIQHQPGCAAIGCFVGETYKTYWGISNMVLDFFVAITTAVVGYDLKNLVKKSNATFSSTVSRKEARQLMEASRLSFGILLIGLIFLMFPSSLVGIMEMAGFAVFKSFGPFYIFGLLLAGVFNFVIYIWLHAEIRNAARNVCRRNENAVDNITTIKMQSTNNSPRSTNTQNRRQSSIISHEQRPGSAVSEDRRSSYQNNIIEIKEI